MPSVCKLIVYYSPRRCVKQRTFSLFTLKTSSPRVTAIDEAQKHGPLACYTRFLHYSGPLFFLACPSSSFFHGLVLYLFLFPSGSRLDRLTFASCYRSWNIVHERETFISDLFFFRSTEPTVDSRLFGFPFLLAFLVLRSSLPSSIRKFQCCIFGIRFVYCSVFIVCGSGRILYFANNLQFTQSIRFSA